ncbi:NAD(P)/FAD-dependent oxidoreductase [Aquimarina algiphila]|uniref:NAD(P)/FAD-dependent oxidoreductase n=1 Tax=Aquimarina algiphila TaxID=2047982 RepID=A0A554VFV5_9FLAO|nr:NAD(P)/FAD-dependent oxidoreductase [Aquimarina algiphila]TSE06142.1 NAD(P)/FAD-dependent oxidoreductase [Aquimarina algiphila]
MNENSHVLIIGGGLAGLTSAIHLAKAGVLVTLIEKDTYPKHKVCGEYISNEVLPYFEFLDINLEKVQPVTISNFVITTQKGDRIQSTLPLGGFGISRYTLDYYLWEKAKEVGVRLINDQVIDIQYQNDTFSVKTNSNIVQTCDYVIGAYGKRTTLDKALKRDFSFKKSPWLAVKAHYKANFDSNTVSLHNFKGGYCGLSMVEDQKVNVCYLVNYDSFKKHKNINVFQDEVMRQNPYLDTFFSSSELLFDKPITISQINFERKNPVEDHIFMTGDAAGLIHPLCGNGMAMAIQSAQLLCELLIKNHNAEVAGSRKEIERLYIEKWNNTFSKRLYAGRILQKILLNGNLQQISYAVANVIPSIVPKIIKQTHGEPLIC